MTYTELFTQLIRTEIVVWNALDDRLRSSVGVSVSQYQALAAVARHDGAARVHDISTELVITVGAGSKLVDRLERDRHAVREANPADRRSSLVVLTGEGREVLAIAVVAVEEQLRELLGELSAARVVDLTRDLSALRGSVES
jgi:DNA-binding MarR family transcriptional regulator